MAHQPLTSLSPVSAGVPRAAVRIAAILITAALAGCATKSLTGDSGKHTLGRGGTAKGSDSSLTGRGAGGAAPAGRAGGGVAGAPSRSPGSQRAGAGAGGDASSLRGDSGAAGGGAGATARRGAGRMGPDGVMIYDEDGRGIGDDGTAWGSDGAHGARAGAGGRAAPGGGVAGATGGGAAGAGGEAGATARRGAGRMGPDGVMIYDEDGRAIGDDGTAWGGDGAGGTSAAARGRARPGTDVAGAGAGGAAGPGGIAGAGGDAMSGEAGEGGAGAGGIGARSRSARTGQGGATGDGASGADDSFMVGMVDAPGSQARIDEEVTPQTLGGMLPMVVGVDEQGQFDFDRAVLRPEVKDLLDQLALKLEDAQYDRLDIFGYTDRIGTDEYNQQLSERRAWAVARYLMDKGVPLVKIRVEGRGSRESVIAATECADLSREELIACFQRDRRVQIEASIRKSHVKLE